MAEVTIDGLLATIERLGVIEKHQLWKYLDSELFEDDDSLDDQLSADIEAAYADYAAGDYLTIQEYRSQRVRKSA
jgi:hypothetical protein